MRVSDNGMVSNDGVPPAATDCSSKHIDGLAPEIRNSSALAMNVDDGSHICSSAVEWLENW